MIILADESVDFNIVRRLREDDYKVQAVIETSPGISDEAVLVAANKLEAILLTEDTDFGELTYRPDDQENPCDCSAEVSQLKSFKAQKDYNCRKYFR